MYQPNHLLFYIDNEVSPPKPDSLHPPSIHSHPCRCRHHHRTLRLDRLHRPMPNHDTRARARQPLMHTVHDPQRKKRPKRQKQHPRKIPDRKYSHLFSIYSSLQLPLSVLHSPSEEIIIPTPLTTKYNTDRRLPNMPPLRQPRLHHKPGLADAGADAETWLADAIPEWEYD